MGGCNYSLFSGVSFHSERGVYHFSERKQNFLEFFLSLADCWFTQKFTHDSAPITFFNSRHGNWVDPPRCDQ